MSGSVGGVTPGSTQAIEVDTTAISRPDKDHSRMQNENHVTASSSQAQGSSGGSPTDGGREATNAALTHDETERLTAERLATDPSYREAEVKLDTWKDLENDFALIDQYSGFPFGKGDGVVTLADLRALADDPFFPNPDAQAAAKRLLSHMPIWNELAKGDNKVGTQDVTEFVNGMRAKLAEMKDTARAEVVAEHAPRQNPAAPGGTPANGGTPATGSNTASGTQAATAAPTESPEEAKKKADAKAIMEEAGKALPKPPPSQFSGMEGASENMNNMIGWAEAETDRLTTLMGKTDDPAVLKQLETKINQMSRRMQQMTALMNQLMTAMQNISKMYSDIAMNSVRNMR